jgi:hypothetical protein
LRPSTAKVQSNTPASGTFEAPSLIKPKRISNVSKDPFGQQKEEPALKPIVKKVNADPFGQNKEPEKAVQPK